MSNNIGRQVLMLRQAKGWSQKTLAAKAKLTNEYISKIERGKATNVRKETTEAIAKALGVHPSLLLYGKVLEPQLQLDSQEKALYPLTKDEKEMLASYRSLASAKEKRNLREVAKSMKKK